MGSEMCIRDRCCCYLIEKKIKNQIENDVQPVANGANDSPRVIRNRFTLLVGISNYKARTFLCGASSASNQFLTKEAMEMKRLPLAGVCRTGCTAARPKSFAAAAAGHREFLPQRRQSTKLTCRLLPQPNTSSTSRISSSLAPPKIMILS